MTLKHGSSRGFSLALPLRSWENPHSCNLNLQTSAVVLAYAIIGKIVLYKSLQQTCPRGALSDPCLIDLFFFFFCFLFCFVFLFCLFVSSSSSPFFFFFFFNFYFYHGDLSIDK